MICQQLAGVRQRQPEGNSSSQGGACRSGVVGTAQLSQPNVPDDSATSHGPSERMDLVSLRSFSITICPKKVNQAGRQGLVGIIWLFFSRYWHLERRREPSQRLVKPMDFSRTHLTSRPERARENQGKRAPTKFSDGLGDGIRSIRERVKM